MKNGGKIALLGLQKADARINWEKVIFNGLTIRGIYGRKGMGDLVQDVNHASERPECRRYHHTPFRCAGL